MSLPNTLLVSNKLSYRGKPFYRTLVGNAYSIDTDPLEIVYTGIPLYAIVGGAAAVSSNVYVRKDGSWIQASNIYIMDGGTWKEAIPTIYSSVSGDWKS